jgi:excisionase family DNA binding protein
MIDTTTANGTTNGHTATPVPVPTGTMEPLTIDLGQVAKILSLSLKTVKRHVAAGAIPGVRRIGRRVLVSLAELRRWVQAGCPDVSPRPRRRSGRAS